MRYLMHGVACFMLLMIVKKLDIFITKQFGMLFVGTFCISLFVLMMQFLWRYVDELIGKGLTIDVLAQFFWYMGLMLVPQALPLAILLSSLITFGNLGESSELTAIKAAGISLFQSFRSLIFVSLMITLGSFYFQNVIGPLANQKFGHLLLSMKQKSPELEIPEGVFYDGVPGSNIYVQKKNMDTGMLYGVMIYKMTDSFEDAAIILADSGRMQSTADKKHLLLTLQNGEWFENMKSQQVSGNANVPYRRETFISKSIILDFDANFNLADNDFTSNPRTKGLKQLEEGKAQIELRRDTVARNYVGDLNRMFYSKDITQRKDTVEGVRMMKKEKIIVDSVFARMSAEEKKSAMRQALDEVRMERDFLEFPALVSSEFDRDLREHDLETLNKYTTSLICLVFFFIGAPLGAIIRKGGLGVPVIVSVFVFIVYYILDNTGYRMARIGSWPVPFGRLLALGVLVPIASFVTYKANNDSVVFNVDAYRHWMMRILGLREKRSVALKEVIIETPDYDRDAESLGKITEDIIMYAKEQHLLRVPNIINVFFRFKPDTEIRNINNALEEIIEDLGNSRDRQIVRQLSAYPILAPTAHTRPFNRKWKNVLAFCVLPFGAFLYVRMWRYRLRLLNDLRQIRHANDAIINRIHELNASGQV